MKRLSSFAAIGSAVAIMAAVTGCGGSSSNQPGGSAGGNGTIKLMVIGDLSSPVLSLPQLVPGAQAAVNAVNAGGGVNGHKIELLSCNSQADPNVGASCARQAVSKKVSAVVGMLSLQADPVQTILAAANITTIANTALNPLDQTSPTSFPIVSGPAQSIAPVLTLPGYKDCKHPAVLPQSIPISLDGAAKIKKLYATLHTDTKIVTVAPGATDVRPQVATLLSGGTDCVFPLGSPALAVGAVKVIADSGQKVKISQIVGSAPAEALRQIGSAAQGMYATSPFQLPGTSPAADKFAAAMTAVDPKAIQDVSAESAYTGVLIFAQVAKSLTDFSAPKVLEAMNKAQNIDVGTVAPISSFPADSGIAGLKRTMVTKFYSYVFEGQNYKLVSPDTIDIRAGL
jgi:ABC-type branched-subunit amino acid transport system substrate-binding protein